MHLVAIIRLSLRCRLRGCPAPLRYAAEGAARYIETGLFTEVPRRAVLRLEVPPPLGLHISRLCHGKRRTLRRYVYLREDLLSA